jgi:hypothetical protein
MQLAMHNSIQFNSKVIYFGKCEYIHFAPLKHVIKFTREKLVHVVKYIAGCIRSALGLVDRGAILILIFMAS